MLLLLVGSLLNFVSLSCVHASKYVPEISIMLKLRRVFRESVAPVLLPSPGLSLSFLSFSPFVPCGRKTARQLGACDFPCLGLERRANCFGARGMV